MPSKKLACTIKVKSQLLVFFVFLFVISYSVESFSAINPLVVKTEEDQNVQWDLTSTSLTHDNINNTLEATGNVYLKRGSEYLKADFARYYSNTQWVYLKGNVIIQIGKDKIVASEAEFDLKSRTGWIKNGKIFMEGPHMYISGAQIKKHWGDIYTFKDAKVTTCDGDSPAWSITAKEATIEVDGYARLSGSTFQINNVPVAYTPYFLVSTKTSRQTGFLVPELGNSSKKGFHYNQPFFWAIDESNDLTFYENYMSKRGFMQGIKFRTKPYDNVTGWLRVDGLYDQKTDKTNASGMFTDDKYARTNHERYWLRGMYDAKFLDDKWRFKADLDFVSDQDYLSDFKNGLSGFKQSRDELFALFSRDLEEKNKNRKSGALLTYEEERWSLGLSSSYSQDPALGHGNRGLSTDRTVQRLPQADAFFYKGKIFDNVPLEFATKAQAAYMYRRSGTKGSRYNIVPELSIPLASKYGSLIATGRMYNTYYATESPSRSERDSFGSKRERDKTRELYDFDIAAATEFGRVFQLSENSLTKTKENVGESQWTSMRHSIQPRLEYVYRPLEDQSKNPFYDNEDRLTPRTELVYSLTNVFTRKKETVVMEGDKDNQTPEIHTSYHDFLRVRLEQSYDNREDTRKENREQYKRRPFGDVVADVTFYPTENLFIDTKNKWSPYLDSITRHQSSIGVVFDDIGSISSGYDYRKKIDEFKRFRGEENNYIHLSTDVYFLSPVTISASLRQDINRKSNTEQSISVSYTHQCYQFVGAVTIEPDEKNYQFFFVLTGLGD